MGWTAQSKRNPRLRSGAVKVAVTVTVAVTNAVAVAVTARHMCIVGG